MATVSWNRTLQQTTWTQEGDEMRSQRREILCELDGMLAQLEELNLRGGEVPTRVLVALRRRGVPIRASISAAELIESIFSVQEGYMRHPGEGTEDGDLRRRIAS